MGTIMEQMSEDIEKGYLRLKADIRP